MKLMKLTAAAAVALIVGAGSAFAAERYTLNLYDRELNGKDQVIHLKQELKDAFVGVKSLAGAELLRLEITAKSRQGNGTVEFVSEGRVLASAAIAGHPGAYDRTSAATFYKVMLSNLPTSYGSTWELRFHGNIKVRSIAVLLEEAADGYPRFDEYTFTRVGGSTAAKLPEGDTYKFASRMAEVVLIRVTDSSMNLNRVTVRYTNGQTVRLTRLAGELHKGEQSLAYLPHRGAIDRITVRVRSRNILGSRANYEIYTGDSRAAALEVP